MCSKPSSFRVEPWIAVTLTCERSVNGAKPFANGPKLQGKRFLGAYGVTIARSSWISKPLHASVICTVFASTTESPLRHAVTISGNATRDAP
jgi:hypothetical protein